MILLRISQLSGKYCEVEGGQEKFAYHKDNAGWFPVESINFGFKAVSDSSTDKASGGSGDQPGGTSDTATTSEGGGTESSAATGADQESERDFTSIQVSRFVDGATTSLMGFAMMDRLEKKGESAEKKSEKKADIHFLHSVRAKEEKHTRYIMPYLMITLDNVLIKGWTISAQGDDRPTETLELWYDKAAMRYYRTVDGQHWVGGDVQGWDQYENISWKPTDGEAPYFVQPDY